jgi:hypothetical protein
MMTSCPPSYRCRDVERSCSTPAARTGRCA